MRKNETDARVLIDAMLAACFVAHERFIPTIKYRVAMEVTAKGGRSLSAKVDYLVGATSETETIVPGVSSYLEAKQANAIVERVQDDTNRAHLGQLVSGIDALRVKSVGSCEG